METASMNVTDSRGKHMDLMVVFADGLTQEDKIERLRSLADIMETGGDDMRDYIDESAVKG